MCNILNIFRTIMKNNNPVFSMLLIAFFSFSLFSCDGSSDKEKENYLNCYKEILFIRLNSTDTSIANRKILSIYGKYGFTKESFIKTFKKLSKNPEEYLNILDSLRQQIINDMSNSNKK